jgi:hypothetical protein
MEMAYMKNYGLVALAVCLMIGFAPKANAAGSGKHMIIVAPTVYYNTGLIDTTALTGGSKSDSSEMAAYGRLGFRFNFPLYVGAVYAVDNITVKGASGPDTTDSMAAYGPSAGIVLDNGFFLIGHYFAGATRDYKNNNLTTKYKEGSGFGGDIGYVFHISQHIGIAPEIHYRDIDYKKVTPAGASTDTTATTKTSDLQPYLGVWVMF